MTKKTAMFDLDGVCVDLNGALEKRLHSMGYVDFNLNNILTYDLNKSLDWSLPISEELQLMRLRYPEQNGLHAERDFIFKQYGDLSLFHEAPLYDKVRDEILDLSQYCNIVFHSYAFNNDIAKYKGDMLHKEFGEIHPTIITSVGHKKPALLNMDYVVEDNIHDVTEYAKVSSTSVYLCDKPYNQYLYNNSLAETLLCCERIADVIEAIHIIRHRARFEN